jgi:hypothetical protein
MSTPYQLAHGLLDYAQYLTSTRDAQGAAAIEEARGIACAASRRWNGRPASRLQNSIRSRRYPAWKSPPTRPGVMPTAAS